MKKEKEHLVKETNVLKKNIEFRVRTLSGINYLFGNNLCWELNDVANSIWEHINGMDNLETIIADIAKEYDVPVQTIENDIMPFLDKMIEEHVYLIKDDD